MQGDRTKSLLLFSSHRFTGPFWRRKVMERYNSANSGQLVKHGETTGSFDIAPSPPLLLGVRSTILHLSSATNMVKNGDTRNPQDSRNNMKQHETTWNNQLHPSATSAWRGALGSLPSMTHDQLSAGSGSNRPGPGQTCPQTRCESSWIMDLHPCRADVCRSVVSYHFRFISVSFQVLSCSIKHSGATFYQANKKML